MMKINKNQRPTIGIMLGDMESDYVADLLSGFYSCAREEDVNIIFMAGVQIPPYCLDIIAYNLDDNYNYQYNTIYDYVHFMNVDALTVATGSISHCYYNYDKAAFLDKYVKVPYIIAQDVSEDKKIPYMISDNYMGMRACIEHLAKDHGYKKIGYLGGPKVNPDAMERLKAYRDVMKECGNTVEESMIAYGNYTEMVEDLVIKLLDENPGLEAIACGNDNMAKACYKICQQRSLMVGRDIAVTGFDDVDIAKKMQPTLTSVSQRSFSFSYAALKKTIAQYKGKTASSKKMPTFLVKRNSCGCGVNGRHLLHVPQEELEVYIQKEIDEMASTLLGDVPYKEDVAYYTSLIKEYFLYIYRTVLQENTQAFNMQKLLGILQELVEYPGISDRSLVTRFLDLLQILTANASMSAREQLVRVFGATQEFVYNAIHNQAENVMRDLNRKAWFVPSFTRDLSRKGSRRDLREVFRPVMERFQMMNVRSCYIYLFEEPAVCKENVSFQIPDKIYLTAYYNEKEMVSYTNEERPCVTVENGFSSFIYSEKPSILNSFILSSEEKQYGIMLCEVAREDISFLQLCSMQLGALLRYIDLNCTEQESYQELQKSLRVIQEKNHILSFISEYDELSHLLNRRGFIEKVIHCCKENDGRKAFFIFCDLDHLKEINDKFGHPAGDLAIKTATERLDKVLPKDSIIARIGGDEFIVLVFSEMPGFRDAIVTQLKDEAELFNQNSKLPYYVEFSIGIHEFYCEPDLNIGELMKKSDELLYEAKKNRRKSICR